MLTIGRPLGFVPKLSWNRHQNENDQLKNLSLSVLSTRMIDLAPSVISKALALLVYVPVYRFVLVFRFYSRGDQTNSSLGSVADASCIGALIARFYFKSSPVSAHRFSILVLPTWTKGSLRVHELSTGNHSATSTLTQPLSSTCQPDAHNVIQNAIYAPTPHVKPQTASIVASCDSDGFPVIIDPATSHVFTATFINFINPRPHQSTLQGIGASTITHVDSDTGLQATSDAYL